MQNTPPFRHPELPLHNVRDTHRIVRMEPDHDATLRYALPIPKGWGRATRLVVPKPHPHAPEVIGVFSPTSDLSGPRIIVSVKRLRWEVDPLHWVTYGCTVGGWQLATARYLDAPRADRFEVGGMRLIKGRVDVRRRIGFVDNGRLFQVDVAAPADQWADLHDLLWSSAALLQLHKPTGRRAVESHPRYNGQGLSFCLPASWRVSRAETATGLRWFGGVEADVQKTATLRIDVARRDEHTPPPDLRRRAIAKELRARDLLLAAHAERNEHDPAADLDGWGGTYRVDGSYHDTPYELRIAHRDTDRHAIDYISIAPRPGTYHLDWMRTTRALELATLSSQCP